MTALELLKDEKFYSKLDLFLNDINRKGVTIRQGDKKICVKTFLEVVETIIQQLKDKDPVFKCFFNRISYVGSFYDGLRVAEATEFDINLILNIPCAYDKIKVENGNVCSGYVRLNMQDTQIEENKTISLPCKKVFQKFVSDRGYLLHDQVLRWLEGCLDKVFDKGKCSVTLQDRDYEVKWYKNGPAHTLLVREGNFKINIDLSPVIEFPSTVRPPTPIRWIESMAEPWIAVPKPMQDNTFWRLSFPSQEKQLMAGQLHLKYINRLLKKFRDANRLQISSYYLKTLFLWEAFDKNQRNNQVFWKKPPSYLFPYMVAKLAQALEEKTLKFFWHKKMNLFRTLNDKLLENMEGQVKRILVKLNKLIENKDIKELEVYVYKIFGVEYFV